MTTSAVFSIQMRRNMKAVLERKSKPNNEQMEKMRKFVHKKYSKNIEVVWE